MGEDSSAATADGSARSDLVSSVDSKTGEDLNINQQKALDKNVVDTGRDGEALD